MNHHYRTLLSSRQSLAETHSHTQNTHDRTVPSTKEIFDSNSDLSIVPRKKIYHHSISIPQRCRAVGSVGNNNIRRCGITSIDTTTIVTTRATSIDITKYSCNESFLCPKLFYCDSDWRHSSNAVRYCDRYTIHCTYRITNTIENDGDDDGSSTDRSKENIHHCYHCTHPSIVAFQSKHSYVLLLLRSRRTTTFIFDATTAKPSCSIITTVTIIFIHHRSYHE